MPHISKKFIQQKVFYEIHSEFIFTLSKLSAANLRLVSKALFTKTERLMLAKRLTIIYLLAESVSLAEIYNILKVSPTTVSRFNHRLETGKYDELIKIFRRKKNREIFWNDLEKILRAGLPPRGHGRWKWLKEYKQ